MLTIRQVGAGGAHAIDLDEVVAALHEPVGDRFVWVDLDRPSAVERAVLDRLELPALVVEDMRDDRHLPKVEVVEHTLSLTVHGLDVGSLGDEMLTVELDCAMRPGLLVTYHEHRVESAHAVGERLDDGTLGFARPMDLLHRLLDVMNDVFLPFVDHIDRRLDVVEEDVLDEPTEATRRDLYELQRDVIQLRRVVVPQAEVIRRLGREQPPGWRDGDTALVRDLYDHLNRMVTLSDSYHQLLDSAMQSYRSALDDRLNEMLRTLTIVSAVLLPVSVAAGLWGMNFAIVPGTDEPDGFWWLLGTAGLLVLAMLGWFWSRGWIGGGARRRARRRRSALDAVLEVPVLGTVLSVPVAGTRVMGRALRRTATVEWIADDDDRDRG